VIGDRHILLIRSDPGSRDPLTHVRASAMPWGDDALHVQVINVNIQVDQRLLELPPLVQTVRPAVSVVRW
jgi:hypothetical protein